MEKNIGSDFIERLKIVMNIESPNPKDYSSLSLALLGDAIYDMALRFYILSKGDKKINLLHANKSYYVRAKSQAEFIDFYQSNLSTDELLIFKRARNVKSKTTAKNATVIEYRKSTGFEALIGYLYLNKEIDRLVEIIKESIIYNGRFDE